MGWADKSVVITGAARGIGRACAERFAHAGAKVVLADIEAESGERAADALCAAGFSARFVACDVGDKLAIRNLLAAALSAYDHVDVLINNAAIMDDGPFLELEEEELERIWRVNVKGAFLMGQAVARQMVAQIEQGRAPGSIVNMSSINAVFALPDHTAYTISKGAVNQLSKAMALALAPHGIRVNAIAPGSIATPMLDHVATGPEAERRILSRTPLGRVGRPEEIAEVALFLASDAASYMTGETVVVDGGRMPLNLTVPTPGNSI